MRKFTKICLITALFLILVGGTLCVIGSAIGGWRLAREMGRDNSLVRFAWAVPGTYGWRYWGDLDDLDDLNNLDDVAWFHSDSGHSHGTGEGIHHQSAGASYGNVPENYEDMGIRAADVKNLKIEIGGAALYLHESEDDCFRIWTEGRGTYRSYEKNGTFHLEGNVDRGWLLGNRISSEEKVYLCIPKGMVFHEADVEVGGGLMVVDFLSADEIDLSIGAGSITVWELGCKELSVDTGAGEVMLNRVTAQQLDVQNGLGNTYVKGSISRKIDVECNMGNMELALTGREKDYNYNIDCAMGSVEIGGKSYGPLADDLYINNRAAGECSVECSMGAISINFSNSNL